MWLRQTLPDKPPAQVALNWVATQPGMTSTIIGATKIAQLDDNLQSIEFEIPVELRKRLDEVSALEPAHPYTFFKPEMQGMLSGGTKVEPWLAARVYAPPSQKPAGVSARATTK